MRLRSWPLAARRSFIHAMCRVFAGRRVHQLRCRERRCGRRRLRARTQRRERRPRTPRGGKAGQTRETKTMIKQAQLRAHSSFQGAMLSGLLMIVSFAYRVNLAYQVPRGPRVTKEPRYTCSCYAPYTEVLLVGGCVCVYAWTLKAINGWDFNRHHSLSCRVNKAYQDMVYRDLRYCIYGVNSIVNSVIYRIASTV